MIIEVRLFATFRINRYKIKKIEIPEGSICKELLNVVGIDHNDVSILMINGIHSNVLDKLKDQDIVSLFPPVGGG
ncbi:MAG: MoaD/ThiS family protein [Clostridiales bacterium]|nr:MoaD/ThiS family protein [Clostridiales bacterium]